jgi:hypothetical protein
MWKDVANPIRDWREIAAEAEKETDLKRLLELTNELERALDARDRELQSMRESSPKRKSKDADSKGRRAGP